MEPTDPPWSIPNFDFDNLGGETENVIELRKCYEMIFD